MTETQQNHLFVLRDLLRDWALGLGFDDLRIQDVAPLQAHAQYQAWLAKGYHGDMAYLARHEGLRRDPSTLLPGALRVISVRMNYLPSSPVPQVQSTDWRQAEWANIAVPDKAVISVYARGRDYHKVLRKRLQKLAGKMNEWLASQELLAAHVRAMTDSAPIMEVELARKAQLGWRGKHTLLLNRQAGSFFFLGELLTDLPLPVDETTEEKEHCGTCSRCMAICPTQAIVGPYQLDARRCISYLTIEHAGPIPIALRPLMGNRIYGCDDCQLICPWNKFAKTSNLADFHVRNGLDNAELVNLFRWTETEFKTRLAGSPILRIGHERWLRNIAVAMGNALAQTVTTAQQQELIRQALNLYLEHPSTIVREHVIWALAQSSAGELTKKSQ